MTSSVYIADIDVNLIPSNRRSRLHPVHKNLKNYPVVMDENNVVNDEIMMKSINRMFKDKDMSKYRIKYSVSNCKFSTKCQWSK